MKHYEGGESNNVSCEKEKEYDNHTAERNPNEDEYFGDEFWNLKEDDAFTIVYRNINTLSTYNRNTKRDA